MNRAKYVIISMVLGVVLIGTTLYQSHATLTPPSIISYSEQNTGIQMHERFIQADEMVQEYANDYQIPYTKAAEIFPREVFEGSQTNRISYKIYERVLSTDKIPLHPSVKLYVKLVDGRIDTIYTASVYAPNYGFQGRIFTTLENFSKIYYNVQGNFYRGKKTRLDAFPKSVAEQAWEFNLTTETTDISNAYLYVDGHFEE